MVEMPRHQGFRPVKPASPKTSFGYSIPTKTGVFLNTSKLGAMVNFGTLPSAASAQRSTKDASVSVTGVGHGDERPEPFEAVSRAWLRLLAMFPSRSLSPLSTASRIRAVLHCLGRLSGFDHVAHLRFERLHNVDTIVDLQ
jgi:hypothetical protein